MASEPAFGWVKSFHPLKSKKWMLFLLCVLLAPSTLNASVVTLRYDLPTIDLATAGNELTLDYLFPTDPAEIVATRLVFTFETQDFDASNIGLVLQPPIDDPVDPDDRLLSLFLTGEDLGWTGTGTFSHVAEITSLNGRVLDAPPGATAMLYGLTFFHADRLTDPGVTAPLGGRFVDSYFEVDYVVVPEPGAIALMVWGLVSFLGRRSPGKVLSTL